MIGCSTEITAVRAMLNDKPAKCKGYAIGVMAINGHFDFWSNYTVRVVTLGYQTYHLVAISDLSGLMLCDTDEALWRKLQETDITTPLLREWVPFIRQRLERDEKLVSLTGSSGLDLAAFDATSDDLDAIVSSGLACGAITIPN